jgi:hypothetical protein
MVAQKERHAIWQGKLALFCCVFVLVCNSLYIYNPTEGINLVLEAFISTFNPEFHLQSVFKHTMHCSILKMEALHSYKTSGAVS